MHKSLTGIWHGLYSYPRFLEPVYFVATLISQSNSVFGTTHEAIDGRSGAPLQLFASIEGTRTDTTISFNKRYDGTNNWSHIVDYQGMLSADADEIEGEWSIAGNWSGRFLMMRKPGATEVAVRGAYEKA
jgi:hypothetical protein